MQINSRLMILVIAALVAGLMAVVVKNRLTGKAPTTVEDTKRILIAKRDVQAGKFVDAGMDLEWIPATDEYAEADVVRSGKIKKSDFGGGIARKALKAGKPISPDDITKAGDGGFLSAVLEPEMRAVSIAVTATTGAAGFIAPGDRVDLIVTHRIKASRGESTTQDTVVSETFVRDVRVVAVDQSLGTPENKAQLAKNVTVEVSEAQAEQIAVATEMGKISLALRSAMSGDKTAENTKDKEAEPLPLGQRSTAPRVQVIRGGEKEDLQFFQGAQ